MLMGYVGGSPPSLRLPPSMAGWCNGSSSGFVRQWCRFDSGLRIQIKWMVIGMSVVPLYQISVYRDDFFRVTKCLYNPSFGGERDPETFKENDTKLDNALCRARTIVREYALCNDWDYFCTLTFSPLNVRDRWDLKGILVVLTQWLQNVRKRYCPGLRYLLVPERHQSGAWHFHGLLKGVSSAELPYFAPKRLRKNGFLDWPLFRLRFGWCSLSPVKNAVGVAFYTTKYITKSLAGTAALKGVHTHYQSRGLRRSLRLGCRYRESLLLSGQCRTSGPFYSSRFFRLKDVGFSDFSQLVDLCDEVTDMYKSYVLCEPETKQPLFIVGGDDSDEALQMVLEFFNDAAFDLSRYGSPPEVGRQRR